MSWQTHASRIVYENRWITVREDEVTMPDGSAGVYGVVTVNHPSVLIMPETDEGEVLLVRLDRHTIGESLEVPAGGSDGQDPLIAARRELLEETGHSAADWQQLGRFHSLNGVANGPAYVFLARGLTRVDGGSGMAEEGVTELVRADWAGLKELIRGGELHDSESIAAITYAAFELGWA